MALFGREEFKRRVIEIEHEAARAAHDAKIHATVLATAKTILRAVMWQGNGKDYAELFAGNSVDFGPNGGVCINGTVYRLELVKETK